MINRSLQGFAITLTVLFMITASSGKALAGSSEQRYSHDASEKEIANVIAGDARNRAESAVEAAAASTTDSATDSATDSTEGAMGKQPRNPLRPVEDTANFRYVLMSSQEPSDEIVNLRHSIAQNLPANVKLVILGDTSEVAAIKSEYAPLLGADRLIIATDNDTSGGLWARDSFPVPVYEMSSQPGRPEVSLVAAHYYRDFSSWDAIASAVGDRDMQKVGFTFVGGNILSDQEGNCFSVNSYRLFTATEADLKASYGCKVVHLMPHVRGLGDVDEVLKPLPGNKMLTNSVEYKADLEAWGYQVILIPALPAPGFRCHCSRWLV